MRWGACLPLVLTALLLVARRCQAAESRLYKPVDVDKLEEEWLEEEDEEWHEDTLEWRERKWRLKEEEQQSKSAVKPPVETKLSFMRLKREYSKANGDTLALKLNSLMRTGGLNAKFFFNDEFQQMVIMQYDGRYDELRRFVLGLDEAKSFRIDDKDYFPPKRPAARRGARSDTAKPRDEL